MKNKLYFIFLSALIPSLVNALGLGKLELNSALNEPFEARIQLLSPTVDGLDSLEVNLADSNAFERADLDRPSVLSHLKFVLQRSIDDEPDYIRVFSTELIREPFLNFLVEINWSNGRLYREYTVLLDLPLYDPKSRAAEFTKKPELDEPVHEAVNTGVLPSNINYTGGDYGPITGSDTLWAIASIMRPDASVSVNRMMLALLRANPDAFFNQNINGLKRGQILRVPNESELNVFSNDRALEEAKSQHAVWDAIKDNISNVVTERPETDSFPETVGTDSSENVNTTSRPVETNPKLKLVAANKSNVKTEQAASVDPGLGQDLILAQEAIEVLTQENLELKDQVKENETLFEDLKRLLALKDDELAALQEQMVAQGEAITEQLEAALQEQIAAQDEAITEQFEAAVQEQIVAQDEAITEQPEAAVQEQIVAQDEAITEQLEAAVQEQIVAQDEAITEQFEAAVEELEPVEKEEPVEEAIKEEPVESFEQEEVLDAEQEPEPAENSIIGMVNQYPGLIKDILLGNSMIGIAVGGVLIVLILIMVFMKLRKSVAGTGYIGKFVDQVFSNFNQGNRSKEKLDPDAVTAPPDPDAETELSDSEAETDTLDSTLNLIDVLSESEEKAMFGAPEEPGVDGDETEEEALQEVNTYLVFEQFEQAEEFVRNAINAEPENLAYHTKLLEVFYTSSDKKAYEEEARILNNLVGGKGEHWNMATAMWQEISPTRALFEEGDDKDDSPVETTGRFVDITADEGIGVDDSSLNLDIGAGYAAGEAVDPSVDEGKDLSDDTVTLDDTDNLLDVPNGDIDSSELFNQDVSMTESASELEEEFEITVELDMAKVIAKSQLVENNALDFDLATSESNDIGDDLSVDSTGSALNLDKQEEEPGGLDVVDIDSFEDSDEVALDFNMEEAASSESFNDADIGLDLSVAAEDELSIGFEEMSDSEISLEETDKKTVQESDDIMDFDLNHGIEEDTDNVDDDINSEQTLQIPDTDADVELELDDNDEENRTVFIPKAPESEEQSAEFEVATKLDLAKAYVELGDKDNAKTILDEVMVEGNDEQKKQAEELLGQI